MFTAKDPQTHDYFKWHNARIVREDSRLSLVVPGQSYKAINLARVREPPIALTPYEVEFLIDTIAGSLDIESIVTKPKTATHKMKWDILESKHFVNARSAFNRMSRVTQQVAPMPSA